MPSMSTSSVMKFSHLYEIKKAILYEHVARRIEFVISPTVVYFSNSVNSFVSKFCGPGLDMIKQSD